MVDKAAGGDIPTQCKFIKKEPEGTPEGTNAVYHYECTKNGKTRKFPMGASTGNRADTLLTMEFEDWNPKPSVGRRPTAGCFAKGTEILMADGTKLPVEKVSVGDIVVGGLVGTNQIEDVEVIGTDSHKVQSYMKISFSNGSSLSTSTSQPIFTTFGPVAAMYLKAKALPETATGKKLEKSSNAVLEVERIPQEIAVYSLSLGGAHTFFAGEGNINVSCDAGFPSYPIKD